MRNLAKWTPKYDAVDELLQTSALVPEEWAVVAVEEALGEIEADSSWAAVVIEEALSRLTAAQRKLIGHLVAHPFDLSRNDFDVRSAEAAEASASVLASVAKGEVTPDEAGRIMALLSSHKSIVAAGDLERRIAALEEAAR